MNNPIRTLASWLVAALVLFFSPLTPAAGRPDFLVDADWLATHIKDPKLVVLEVRYHPHRHTTVGHIPGAVQVRRFADLGANDEAPIMRFPGRAAFQATLRGWGIDDDSTLVIYDDSSTALASRLAYLLDRYGFDMSRVKVLNGGTVEWTAFNDLTREPTRRAPGKVTLKEARAETAVEWPEVYREFVARRDPQRVLIDARPRDMYDGTRIQHAIQGGHIPGAINLVSLEGVDGQSQQWKSLSELKALYGKVPADAEVVVYCHDGFRSTLAWLQLKALGYRKVRVFNGGWSAWDRTLTLPVVKGGEPFDDDFRL